MSFLDPSFYSTDVPECSMNTDNCSPFAKCQETPGSFTCTSAEKALPGNGKLCKSKQTDIVH